MVTARAFSATFVVGVLSSVLSGQQWTDPSPHTRSFDSSISMLRLDRLSTPLQPAD
jgi:hypothetical protein